MQLVANQQEPSGDGVGHQVEAGSHDNGNDAKVDGGAGQCPGATFKHLQWKTNRCLTVNGFKKHLYMSPVFSGAMCCAAVTLSSISGAVMLYSMCRYSAAPGRFRGNQSAGRTTCKNVFNVLFLPGIKYLR